jgi:Sortase domain/PT repeat
MASLIVAVLLVGCANDQAGEGQPSPLPPPFVAISVRPSVQPSLQPTLKPTIQPSLQPTVQPTVQHLIPGPLIAPNLSLQAGPVDVPLELRIPSIQVSASVAGVGLTAANVMDAPKGPISDPVWQKAFWYRGSGIPGDSGTATFAGHVNDVLGQPAVFARLKDLLPGDQIIIHDTRSGQDVVFLVTESKTYSLQEAVDPTVLKQVYGAGPVVGRAPEPATDGLSHLTLITCAGDFVGGSYDHRLVIYAIQSK